jgi:hypothetical protein
VAPSTFDLEPNYHVDRYRNQRSIIPGSTRQAATVGGPLSPRPDGRLGCPVPRQQLVQPMGRSTAR